MSVDSGTGTGFDVPAGIGCGLCGGSLDSDDRLVVQCYAEADRTLPERAAADGFLGVCADCAAEVDELVGTWTGHEAPPVGPERSIAAGYRERTDDCSFCDRPVGDDPLLGVEYVRGAGHDDERRETGDAPTGYANYALCGGCVPVFDEFLDGVGDDASV